MRDNSWLSERLQHIWQSYFSDLSQKNEILIGFGRRTKARLGSIRQSRKTDITDRFHKTHPASIITINGHFRSEKIPEYVIDAVLAHELVHYLHGFCSPQKQSFYYPHQGGVVNQELKRRGLAEAVRAQKKWTKNHWKRFLNEER